MEYSDPLSTAMGTFMQAYGLMSQNKRAKEAGKRQDAESQALQQYREKQLEQEATKQGNEDLYKQAELQGKYGKKINNGLIEDIAGWKKPESEFDKIKNQLAIQSSQMGLMKNQKDIEKMKKEETLGSKLPADKILSLSEGQAVYKALPEIENTIEVNKDQFGPVTGFIGGLSPYNEKAKTIDSQLSSQAQVFGRFMEDGVLRKEDEEKYKKMFPSRTDTPEVAKNKLAVVKKLLADKASQSRSSLKAGGYDVSGVSEVGQEKLPGLLTGQSEIEDGYQYVGPGPKSDPKAWKKVK